MFLMFNVPTTSSIVHSSYVLNGWCSHNMQHWPLQLCSCRFGVPTTPPRLSTCPSSLIPTALPSSAWSDPSPTPKTSANSSSARRETPCTWRTKHATSGSVFTLPLPCVRNSDVQLGMRLWSSASSRNNYSTTWQSRDIQSMGRVVLDSLDTCWLCWTFQQKSSRLYEMKWRLK